MEAVDQQGNGQAGPITELDFNFAMVEFKKMFPSMDNDVIEAILRANSGKVDATIDQLLVMNADNESQSANQQPIAELNKPLIALGNNGDRSSGATPPPTYNQGRSKWLYFIAVKCKTLILIC
jgi:hypothetical protein